MRNHFVSQFIIPLITCFFLFVHVDAQTADSINSLVRKVLESDFKTIVVHHRDSIAVNECLNKALKCIGTGCDSTLIFYGRAIILAGKAGLPEKLSTALQKMGQYYMSKEKYSEATSCFINAIKIEGKRNDEKRTADLLDEMGTVCYHQEIFGKSLEYNAQALEIYKKLNDTINIAKVFSHLGTLHLSREFCEQRTADQKLSDQKISLNYFFQSIKLCEKISNLNGIAQGNINIGSVFNRMNKPETALGYVEKALTFYQKHKNFQEISETLYNLGRIYNKLQKYDQALNCFIQSNEIAMREKYSDGIQFLYEAIAQTYDNLKDYKNARDFYVKYMIIRDSVYNNEKSRQIFELETNYQAEKKQNEIEKLTLIKRQRTFVIYVLAALLLLVSLLSYFYFRNIRNKKIIIEQNLVLKETQILELEKERQLTAAKSVLQGEEAERSRLAGDLHDGLGGLLSGVKLKLSSMKENAIITSDNLANFNHALDLLDVSITELRRVAHNLMPETLIHYGLRTALNDFIKQVSPEGMPIMRFNTFGEDLRFSKELEITLYRITQELIANSIKHAHAKQIDIQLFTEHSRICVQVNDNGIGFDPERPDTSKKGNGLRNIHDRVTAFSGRFEIFSQPGKGTESTIEFLLS